MLHPVADDKKPTKPRNLFIFMCRHSTQTINYRRG